MIGSSDLQARLNTAISPRWLTLLGEATNAARRLALTLYLVGGAVRDLLMGRTVTDPDLVVERRDFTINAMALRLAPPPIDLLDPRDGQPDIAARPGPARRYSHRTPGDLPQARRSAYRAPGHHRPLTKRPAMASPLR